jgi:hypothetical protein
MLGTDGIDGLFIRNIWQIPHQLGRSAVIPMPHSVCHEVSLLAHF